MPEATQAPAHWHLTPMVTGYPSGSHTERIIDALFPGNPLLCVARTDGKSAGDFATRRREVWRGRLSRCALMVPSPMARAYGRTQAGRVSQHALDAVGPRRFLVVAPERPFPILPKEAMHGPSGRNGPGQRGR
jgi:hypothetical protein